MWQYPPFNRSSILDEPNVTDRSTNESSCNEHHESCFFGEYSGYNDPEYVFHPTKKDPINSDLFCWPPIFLFIKYIIFIKIHYINTDRIWLISDIKLLSVTSVSSTINTSKFYFELTSLITYWTRSAAAALYNFDWQVKCELEIISYS